VLAEAFPTTCSEYVESIARAAVLAVRTRDSRRLSACAECIAVSGGLPAGWRPVLHKAKEERVLRNKAEIGLTDVMVGVGAPGWIVARGTGFSGGSAGIVRLSRSPGWLTELGISARAAVVGQLGEAARRLFTAARAGIQPARRLPTCPTSSRAATKQPGHESPVNRATRTETIGHPP